MPAARWRVLVAIAGLAAAACSNAVTDGVHPNDAGHAIIFQRVDAMLQSGHCVAAPRWTTRWLNVNVTESRRLLQHFLAALAYRTQKALRDAPDSFADFRLAPTTRTPFELVWHMTGVIGYARTFLHGGDFEPPRLGSFADEIARFHATLAALSGDFADGALQARITDDQFLQGPLADAMTHAGQLAMLRRLHGSPVPSENFIFARVSGANLGMRTAVARRAG